MGRQLELELKQGMVIPAGTSTIVLEGDRWQIVNRHKVALADSETISDAKVDELQSLFHDKKLEFVRFTNNTLSIEFADIIYVLATPETDDEDICLWVLPDGRVLSCDAHGFYWDGSISEEHAKRYVAKA
jgi:hypothetical protein